MHYVWYYFTELRLRLVYTAWTFVLCVCLSYTYKFEVMYWLTKPLVQQHTWFIFLEIAEAFSTFISVSVFHGLIWTVPYGIYHLWSFLSPSWYISERQKVWSRGFWMTLCISAELYILAFWIWPWICDFFLSFQSSSQGFFLEFSPRLGSYISFASMFFLLGLFCFQIPWGILLGLHWNFWTWYDLCALRKPVCFFSVVLAGFLSPPDIVTQCALSSMFYSLYEFSILIGFLLVPVCQQTKIL
jgi:sec-independent protein translocase protein TatC